MKLGVGILGLAMLFTPAFAQGKGKGKGKDQNQVASQGRGGGGTSAYVSFSYGAPDRVLINNYYGNPSIVLPPGLAKKGKIPPGWQKKLMPFPVALEQGLPPLPPGCGCARGLYGDRAVIMRGGAILDSFAIDVAARFR